MTNTADWLTSEGADEEDDDSLRYRYYLKWRSISGLNKYFYENLAMSVTGVDSVTVHDRHPRGQGTVDIYIKSVAGLPTQSLIDAVTAVIDADKPQIDDFLVKAPVPVNVDLNVLLLITEGEHSQIRAAVENRLRAMFAAPSKDIGVRLLDINEDLTHSRIISEGMKSDGVKKVVVKSPAADLTVPVGGLAVLKSLVVETESADL